MVVIMVHENIGEVLVEDSSEMRNNDDVERKNGNADKKSGSKEEKNGNKGKRNGTFVEDEGLQKDS